MTTTKLSARSLILAALLGGAGCGNVDGAGAETVAFGLTEITSPPRGFLAAGDSERMLAKDLNGGIDLWFGSPPDGPVEFSVHVQQTAAPSGYERHDGLTSLLYIDPFGHPHQLLYVNAQTTIDTDFTGAGINAPRAKVSATVKAPTPDVIGYVRMQGSQRHSAIVYVSDNDHVIELLSNSAVSYPTINNSFGWSDLTVATRARVSCNRGSAFPYVRSDGLSQISYIGSDNHIHALANWGTPDWGDFDLYAASGETVIPKSDTTAYARSDGYNVIVFEGNDSVIHELAMDGNGVWTHGVLPSVGAINGLPGRPFGYVRGDSVNAVVYISNRNSVHELALRPNGWTDSALPLNAGEVPKGQVSGLRNGVASSVLFQVALGTSLQGRDIVASAGFPWTEFVFP